MTSQTPQSPKSSQPRVADTADFLVGGELPEHIGEDIFEQVASAFDRDKLILSVPAKALADSFFAGLSVLVLNPDGMAIGYTRITPLYEAGGQSWFELGSSWVHEDYRNQGLITASYRKLLSRNEDKNIMATSSTQAALAVGKKLGFVFVARKDLPEPTWRACCICPKEKSGADNNDLCLRAYNEPQQSGLNCYTRVTKATAERFELKTLTPVL